MSIHGVLGETINYPKTYNPDILYAIPRSMGRNDIIKSQAAKLADVTIDNLTFGVDWWHAFEVSWLNNQGISQVAIARFAIPANTPNIVESKSLKLYLNSLNFTQFASMQALKDTIVQDLSACVGEVVEVSLFDLNQFHSVDYANDDTMNNDTGLLIETPKGKCIDNALNDVKTEVALSPHPDASLLSDGGLNKQNTQDETAHQIYSNLLRSNCPVTNQPDWGTLAIEMSTDRQVDYANVLKYILSYRQHNGFHEQCVEQIFADLTMHFMPSKLMVRAWYTRRGGIDINPCRVSNLDLLPKPSRLIRQ